METVANVAHREPWNKGKTVGQKAPFKLRDTWTLQVRFQMENRVRKSALFNLGLDSKLRGCDLVSLKVRDACHGDRAASRAVVATASGVNANLARRWAVGAEQRELGGERLRKKPNESGRTSSSHSPFRSHSPPSSGLGPGYGTIRAGSVR